MAGPESGFRRSEDTMTTEYRCEAITKKGRCKRVVLWRQYIDKDGRRVCCQHVGPGGRIADDDDEAAAKPAELERCG